MERTPWPTWVRAIFWGMNALVCLALLAGWDTTLPASGRLLIAAAVVVGAAAVKVLLGGLTVRLQETGILIHLGSTPVIRRRVPFAEIVSATSVRYRPIIEFGGWGIRGTRRRRAWTARGDQAVDLELTGGRTLLIGSDRPRRLEDRIRSVLADGEKVRRASADRQDPDAR
jgi:hypothetical protein